MGMAKKKPNRKAQKATRQRARDVKTTGRWIEPFLAAFADNGVVSYAAAIAGVTRTHVYHWLKKSKSFAERFDEAFAVSSDKLKAEAFRRAHDGVDEPVFQKGEKVGVIRRYSDTLLVKLLGARFPAEFREHHKYEHSGPDGGAVPISIIEAVKPKQDA